MKRFEISNNILLELSYKNSLFNQECRDNLLKGALEFYKFDEEFIQKTMEQIDRKEYS